MKGRERRSTDRWRSSASYKKSPRGYGINDDDLGAISWRRVLPWPQEIPARTSIIYLKVHVHVPKVRYVGTVS